MDVFISALMTWHFISWPISFFALIYLLVLRFKRNERPYKQSIFIWRAIIGLGIITLACNLVVARSFLLHPSSAGAIVYVMFLQALPVYIVSLISLFFLKPKE